MNNLPATRPALFKDIIRYRFGDIVFTSLYTLLFFLPALMWLIFVNFSFLGTFDNIYNPLLVYSVLALLLALGGTGFGGAFYFFKKLVYSEGANVHRDFFSGVRENYKTFFLAFLIVGLLYGALHFGEVIFHLDESIPRVVGTIFKGVMYVGLFFTILATLFAAAQSVLYVDKYSHALLNGFKFTFGTILKSFGIGLLLLLPFFLYEFVPSVYVEYIVIGVYGLFYFGLGVLSFTLFAHSVFDQTINKNQYPELVNKGLAKEKGDETTYN